METYSIGNLLVQSMTDHASDDGAMVYILSYEPLDDEWVGMAAEHYGMNLAVISGMDWDNDLTPWPAPGAPKGSPDFKGLAPQFLEYLQGTVMPLIERRAGIGNPVRRVLVGVSLSGLFTLWAWMQNDFFTDIASISGSFWYRDFATWFTGLKFPEKKGMAYLSLGNKESHTHVKAFRPVAVDTAAVVAAMRRAGINVVFQMNEGNHYAPFYPRLKYALNALFSKN